MNIALLTAVWGRPKLTRIVLSQLARASVSPSLRVWRVAVYSHDDDWTQDEIADLGWHPVKFRNRPVSEKLNAGIREIDLRWDPDVVMVIDTDCLIPRGWLEWVRLAWTAGGTVFYLNGGAFLNLIDGHDDAGQAFYTEPFQFGPGMAMDWDLVEAVDLDVWPGQHSRNLNSLALQNIRSTVPAEVRVCNHPYRNGTCPLEVKVGDGIHSWENVVQRVGSRQEVFSWAGPDAYDVYDTESVESLWRLKNAPHKVHG